MKLDKRAIAASLAFSATAALAQVATDGTLGPRQSFTGNGITIPSAIGRHINGNLFHSFQVFNVATGQTVSFQPTPITLQTPSMLNIISRVTGGTASTIQGTVRSTAPGVNLYLINPSGFVFGPGALVDVNGSFYASSAHYLRSADGTKFESRGPGVSLTFTTPDGFGFDSSNVAPIVAQGGVLRAREGATVGLVGGGILVGGHPTATTSMQALGGNAILVAVASPGVVAHDGPATTLSGFGAMADVLLQRGAVINVNEGAGRSGGGSVFVRGNNVALDQATVTARTAFGSGRSIDIEAARDLTIAKSNVLAITTGAGNAGRIRIAGSNIVVSNGALVDTSCDPGCTTGNAGALELRANGTLLIDGTQATTFVVSNSFGAGRTGEIDVTAGTLVLDGDARLQGVAGARSGNAVGTGNGSVIRLHTGNILLRNGGQVDASTRNSGAGGRIVVENSGNIRIEGSRVDPTILTGVAPSGFFASTQGSGSAGDIVVSTRSLEVLRGGTIVSGAALRSTGNGGSITVNATESIRISGADERGHSSAIVTNTFGPGRAGEISVAAPRIELVDGGVIESQSEGSGRAGAVHVSGRDLTISGFRSRITSDARSAGDAGGVDVRLEGTLFITTGNDACGINCAGIYAATITDARGGTVTLDVARLVMEGAGRIFTTTEQSGPAGAIVIRAADEVLLGGNSRISSASLFVDTTGASGSVSVSAGQRVVVRDGASVTTSAAGFGGAGSVFVEAGRAIELASRGSVTSEASGAGDAGSVTLRTAGRIDAQGSARVSTSTTAAGDAGRVFVTAGDSIAIASDASIASESTGTGLAGDIDVRSGGALTLTSGGRITTSARLSDGGNIFIDALQGLLNGGRITTAVGTGQGDGGNMEIRIPTLVLRDAIISANAFGGDGGNIHIATSKLLKTPTSSITASSQLGVDGTITLDSPAIDPTGELLAPPPSFLDAGAILSGRCGPRLAGRASSLVILPTEAGGVLPSTLHTSFDRLARPLAASASCEAPSRLY